MESLADGVFVAVGGLTIAVYSVLLFLGARPIWAIVLVLAGAVVLGILINSALSILRDVPSEKPKEPAASTGARSETSAASTVPRVNMSVGRDPLGEHV